MSTAPTRMTPSPRHARTDWLGPVLRWELITGTRRWRYFAIRLAYALILSIVLWFVYRMVFRLSGFSIGRFAEFAAAFSNAVLWVQMIATLVLTPAFVGSALSMEKERRTIDYLFASDLTNREIVVGKLFARGGNLVMILLGAIPIIALAGLFGGIDYWLLFLGTSMNFSLLFSIATLSMAISLHGKSTRQALTGCYVWIIFLLISPYLVMLAGLAFYFLVDYIDPLAGQQLELMFETWMVQWGLGIASCLHPFIAFFLLSMSSSGMMGPGMLGMSVHQLAAAFIASHVILGLVLSFYTTLRLRRVASRENDLPTARARLSLRLDHWRATRRRPVWDSWPLAWKELHASGARRTSRVARILFVFLVILLYAVLTWSLATDRMDTNDLNMTTRFATVGFAFFVYVMLAFRASSCVGEERDRDCWVSLLSTPLSAEEIVWSKAMGSLGLGLRMLLLIAPLWVMAWVAGEMTTLGILTAGTVYFAYATALVGLGVFQSLVQKSTHRAILTTLMIAAVCWGGGQLVTMPVLMTTRSDGLEMFFAASLPWAVLGMIPITDGLPPRGPEANAFLFFSAIFVVGHAFVGVMFVTFAAAIFPHVSGRLEERNAGLPGSSDDNNPISGGTVA